MSDLYRINRLQKLADRAAELMLDLAEHASPETVEAMDSVRNRIQWDIEMHSRGLKGGAKQAHQLRGPSTIQVEIRPSYPQPEKPKGDA